MTNQVGLIPSIQGGTSSINQFVVLLLDGKKKTLWSHQLMQQKHLTKVNTLIILKKFRKLGIEGNFLSLIQSICENLQLTSYLTSKTEFFPPKIENKHWPSPPQSASSCRLQAARSTTRKSDWRGKRNTVFTRRHLVRKAQDVCPKAARISERSVVFQCAEVYF